MAIGINSSFNEPEWNMHRLVCENERAKKAGQIQMQTRIVNLIAELDQQIHDSYGQTGRATADLIFKAILKLTI